MKQQRYLFLTTLVACISALFCNNIYAADFLVDTAKGVIDTTSVNAAAFYQADMLSEFLGTLPSHHHYLVWDTLTVHPYKYNLTGMTDTVVLTLADSQDCFFIAPVMGNITSCYGPRHGRQHQGIDLKLNTGDSVYSAFDGVVRVSMWNGGYGNVIVVRHYNGLETIYGHLSKRLASPGDKVRAGELIGLGGSTGRSTGPHLHFEVRYKGEPIDPNSVISFDDSTGFRGLRSDTLTVCSATFESLKTARAGYGYGNGQIRYYVVRKGDSLSKIAARHNTSVNRLCQLNRLSRNSTLQPGRRLRVR